MSDVPKEFRTNNEQLVATFDLLHPSHNNQDKIIIVTYHHFKKRVLCRQAGGNLTF